MKSSGIVRRVDNLGRIVIPIEIRRALSIDLKDAVEISLEGDSIILRKQSKNCALCGSDDVQKKFGGKYLCADCIEKIKSVGI